MSSLIQSLQQQQALIVRQRFEVAEFFGFETRNKYEILTEGGISVGFAAEQQKGIFGFLLRHFLGHWRSFAVHIFDSARSEAFIAEHPFRFIFQRIELRRATGEPVGALQQRFSILSKSFDVEDAQGRVLMQMRSPIWRLWTFRFTRRDLDVARVEKKWSGALTELFTDRDTFRVSFTPQTSADERALVLAAAIFIDLNYFESKAN